MPLVADIPQALPIEVLQVSQTQAASELGGTERESGGIERERWNCFSEVSHGTSPDWLSGGRQFVTCAAF